MKEQTAIKSTLSTLSEKQVAVCRKLKNCKPLSLRYRSVIQEFLDCCWLDFERDLYVIKEIDKGNAIALLANHYDIPKSDCCRILKFKNHSLISKKEETMKLNKHPLSKHLSVLGCDQFKVARNLRDSYRCNYESNLEEFEYYCKNLFLKDLERLKKLHRDCYGTGISASLAATILADYYNIKLKDSCFILAREGRCSSSLYQKILDKLKKDKSGIQTLIFASRTECQRMLNTINNKRVKGSDVVAEEYLEKCGNHAIK